MKAISKREIGFAILCIICSAVFFVSAAVSVNINSGLEETDQLARLTETQPEETPVPYMYTLMEHEGRVYVYSEGQPFMLTDIDPSGLPSADREKLRQGIGAEDKEALLALIEDFGS